MAYEKTIWENSPSTKTPINKDNLNKIEEGIFNALEKYSPNELEASIEKIDSLRSNNKALEFKIGDNWYKVTSKGKDGVTFIPKVSLEGILSWSNNGSLPNPDEVKIKGDTGTSLRYKGLYQEDEIYQCDKTFIDLVTYKNSLWIKNNSIQSKPDEGNWILAAKQGEKGEQGLIGKTPNFLVENTTTLPEGSSATVTVNNSDKENIKFNFGIPIGKTGKVGSTPNLSIGTVDTLPNNELAYVTITGEASSPRLNFGIPVGETGDMPNFQIKQVNTIAPNELAEVILEGTKENPTLTFNLPRGFDGAGVPTIVDGILSWKGETLENTLTKEIYDKNDNGIVDNAEKVNNFYVNRNVESGEYSNTVIDQKIYDSSQENVSKINNVNTSLTNKINTLETNINNKLETTSTIITINPSDWGSTNKIYTYNNNKITATSYQEITIPNFIDTTQESIKEITECGIVSYDQGAGFIKLYCMNRIPEKSIKLLIIFRGEK